MNKYLRGLIGGIILSGIWIIIFLVAIQNTQYYGLAILPAILIAIFLFIVGFIIGLLICRRKK